MWRLTIQSFSQSLACQLLHNSYKSAFEGSPVTPTNTWNRLLSYSDGDFSHKTCS